MFYLRNNMENYDLYYDDDLNTRTNMDNDYNYYNDVATDSRILCNPEIADYIETGEILPDNLDEFEVRRTLSILAGSELSDEQIDRFIGLNSLLSKEYLDIRDELITPRFIFDDQKAVNYLNRDLAACKDVKTKVFFLSKNEKKTTVAKNICRTCPEIENCLKTALENNEDGIWGGTTLSERNEIKNNFSVSA